MCKESLINSNSVHLGPRTGLPDKMLKGDHQRIILAKLDMNQVPEKLYLGQNLKQYVMKEAVIYKIHKYRQNRCHTNEERWTDHS